METLTNYISELSNHALLMYRTMVIKTELRRRRAILNAQDSHSMIAADQVSPIAVATPSAVIYIRDPSEMKRVFDLFDENKDGRISAEELQLYMKKLGFNLSDEKVRSIVESVDRNSDDLVEFEEFYSLYSSRSEETEESCAHVSPIVIEDDEEEEALLKAFFVFDENKDGLITPAELQQVLLKLGIPEGKSFYGCKKMIEKVDADGNGKVDFFEFKEMMCSNAFISSRS